MRPPVAVALLGLLAADVAAAQVRASELGRVMQTVDGTVITVEYSRPRARGRDSLFGGQVPYGEVWTPGANGATTLAVSKDVSIDGHPVPAGRYSVWIVMAPGPWELVLDRDTTLFHTQGPKPREGQIRFVVRKEQRPFVEVLTWSFPEVRATGTVLLMQWGVTAVPLDVKVTPTQVMTVAPAIGRRIEGRYDLQFEPWPEEPKDTTSAAEAPPMPTRMAFTVRQDKDVLRARMDPPLWPGAEEFVLVRKTDDWFQLAEADADGLKEIWDWATLEFAVVDGHATGFEIRTRKDELMAKGSRLGP